MLDIIKMIKLHLILSVRPAGGYWTSTDDLAKFGEWLYHKCITDSSFIKLIEQYGQEFYDQKSQTIFHSGSISSSSAYLLVSLKTGAEIAIFSDKSSNVAIDLGQAIKRHVFSTVDTSKQEQAEQSVKALKKSGCV